jgi:hypothetical protein
MAMPGFTAEVSLGPAVWHYQTSGNLGVSGSGFSAIAESAVTPAFNLCSFYCSQLHNCAAQRKCCICQGGQPRPDPRLPCGYECWYDF